MKPIFIVSPTLCRLFSLMNGGAVNVFAIALFPFVISAESLDTRPITKNHETIHFHQQKELLVVPFYLLYLYYFIRNRLRGDEPFQAYWLVPFEREAYKYDSEFDYLTTREPYSWWKFR